MIEASCHCGNISLKASKLLDTVTSCNCSNCYRIGALWAYYTADQVVITERVKSNIYLWGNKLRSYHNCTNCGCTTHYTQLRDDGTNRVAINTRMENPELFKAIPIRYFDGAGSFKYITKKIT
ncbi:MAG: aldehyde-activating protein [Sedimenticola sp.]|nr:aldehyde-activating protein [Sedimenticola sp.]